MRERVPPTLNGDRSALKHAHRGEGAGDLMPFQRGFGGFVHREEGVPIGGYRARRTQFHGELVFSQLAEEDDRRAPPYARHSDQLSPKRARYLLNRSASLVCFRPSRETWKSVRPAADCVRDSRQTPMT